MLDLAGGHEPGHLEPDFVPSAAIGKEVKRYLVVRLTENLFVFPGMTPDMTGHHVANGFQVADVEVDELWRWWSTPIFVSVEIKTSEARKSTLPASTRGVHCEDNVGCVFQEGNAVSSSEGSFPPDDVFHA